MFFTFFFLIYCNINQCIGFLENYNNKTFQKDYNALFFQEFGEYKFIGLQNCLINIKLWGAGGGSIGGYGGFSNGTLLLLKNQNYILWVGEGGKTTFNLGLNGTFGGGGHIGRSMKTSVTIGTGGGLTGLFLNEVLQNHSILIAGGGGGGSFYNKNIPGGNGGGFIGLNGSLERGIGFEGKGGTQFFGGDHGLPSYYYSESGGPLYGGRGASTMTTSYSGGSGGGGYFGGGGGATGNYAGGPGGGGSGFIHPLLVINGYTNIFQNHTDNFNYFGYPNCSGLAIFEIYNSSNLSLKKSISLNIILLIFLFQFFFL